MNQNLSHTIQLELHSHGSQKIYTTSGYTIRSGVGVPDWRNKLKRAQDATSVYSLRKRAVTKRVPGSWLCSTVYYTNPPINTIVDHMADCTGYGCGFGGSSLSNPAAFVPGDCANYAKNLFVQRCLSTQRVFQGSTVLGELHKTIESIRHPLSALRNGTRSYLDLVKERAGKAARTSRGAGKSASAARRRSVATAVQGTYLEYVYGILPTLQDMSDAVKAAAHLVDPDLPVRKTVSAIAKYRYYPPSLQGGGDLFAIIDKDGNSNASVRSDVSVLAEGSVRFSGAVRCSTPGADRVRLLGFAARDFIPTVWELLPYSFLVDYFLNVGNIFDALSFNVSDLAWSCQAVRASLIETHGSHLEIATLSDQFGSKLGTSMDTPSLVEMTDVSYQRQPLDFGSLIPEVQLTVPSARQLVNIGALVAQHSSVVKYIASLL